MLWSLVWVQLLRSSPQTEITLCLPFHSSNVAICFTESDSFSDLQYIRLRFLCPKNPCPEIIRYSLACYFLIFSIYLLSVTICKTFRKPYQSP